MKNPFAGNKIRITQTQHNDHQALDMVGDDNWNVVATEDGVVTSSRIVTDKSDLTWTYGHYIKYKLADGTYILCAHLSERLVKAGDTIKAGQVIGVMGATGNANGAHLHIEHRAANGSTRLSVYEYLGVKNEVGDAQEAEAAPAPAPAPEAVPAETINEGDIVRIIEGATYSNGVKVPGFYIGKDFTVQTHNAQLGRTLIKELYSWVDDQYITKTGAKATAKISENSKVKISAGAVYTNGVKVPSECIGVTYTVMQTYADKALLREIMSWVSMKYLTLV